LKKIFSILVILLLLTLLTPAVFAGVYDSYDYYIKDFRVSVIANNDRSYDVTETITVLFNIESRGIYRDIQTVSSAERYRVENINVAGDPFLITPQSDYINVRIGDPGIELIGEKTYTITYTRVHYDDGVPDYDYFYMDLIGDGWDVPIASFSAEVRLPPSAVIHNYTITSGSTGLTRNDFAEGAEYGNVIDVWMKQPLGPNMAVTLNVELLPGAFPDAVAYASPLIIHQLDVSAELDEYGVMKVTEVYDATVNDAVKSWHPSRYSDGVTVLSGIDPSGEPNPYFTFYSDFLNPYVGKRIQFSLIYERSYPIEGWDASYRFSFELVGNAGEVSVEKYTLAVVSPYELFSAAFRDNFKYRDPDAYVSSLGGDGRRLYIEADADPDARYAYVVFSSYGFKRAMNAGDFIIPVIAAAAAVLIFLFAFVKKPGKKFITPIEFYPPDGMNPAEMGYIIDGKISGRDVTSLIYYWASHGHLAIEITDKSSNFILHRGTELDSAHTDYEKVMFRKLFTFGDWYQVKSSALKNVFYTTVSETCKAVILSYTGERSLDRFKRSAWWAAIALIIGCALMFYTFSKLWVYTAGDTINTGITMTIMYMVMAVLISYYHRYKYKKPKSNAIVLAIFLILSFIFTLSVLAVSAGTSLTIASSVITAVSLAVSSFAAPFISRKTDFAISLLERIVGFKIFLRTAEKSRLEMLLAQNPDYYYNVLPYAQILGVSDIWKKKFDGLLRQPPTWCYGDGAEMVMHSGGMAGITSSLARSMTSSPSSDSGGSSGGGFSGGGSSGGGGGGGGGRW